MRKVVLVAIFCLFFASMLAFAGPCKAGQYDMLEWMAPQVGTVNGHWNVVEPLDGKFYWVKGSAGYPWDLDLFDGKYIYQSVTEKDWSNPKTFKKFITPLPWMPRCVTIPVFPGGKLASILVARGSSYESHTSCVDFTVQDLGYVVNELWGPDLKTIGALPPTDTLTLSYRYSCDQSYSNCRYKETFEMQKANGMVQWTYYALGAAGQYEVRGQTTHGLLSYGSVAPVHPCWQ